MKIIFIEFLWQAEEILKGKSKFKEDLIVSLRNETSYLFMNNNIKYLEAYEICNHENLWKKYRDITNHSLNITKLLDNSLWKIDERFRKLEWTFFDDNHYIFKIIYEQLYYYSEIINQVIEKYNPSEIWAADSKEIKINSSCMIDTEISVLKFLLQSTEINREEIKINYMKNTTSKRSDKKNYLNFLDIITNRKRIKNFILKLDFLFNFYFSKPKYVSIGCDETTNFKKLYPLNSNDFILYRFENLIDKKLKKDWIFFDQFINYLRNNTTFKELLIHKKINLEPIFYKILLKLTKRLNFYIIEYRKAEKIVKKIKPTSIIFRSTSPEYSANIFFRKICKNFNIPYITWIHGATGTTNSLLTYDVTDFRLSKNIISWGEHLKEQFNSDKSVFNELNLQPNIKVFPIGSAKLDYNYKKCYSKKKNLTKEKKEIVFMTGTFQIRNEFYFGYNNEKSDALWKIDYEILKILKKYQDEYSITFKDYPNGNLNYYANITS